MIIKNLLIGVFLNLVFLCQAASKDPFIGVKASAGFKPLDLDGFTRENPKAADLLEIARTGRPLPTRNILVRRRKSGLFKEGLISYLEASDRNYSVPGANPLVVAMAKASAPKKYPCNFKD